MSTCGKNIATLHIRKLFSIHTLEILNSLRGNGKRSFSLLSGQSELLIRSRVPYTLPVHRCPLWNKQIRCLNGKNSVRCFSYSARKDMKFVQFAVPTENDKIGPKRLGALLAGDGSEDFVVDISGVDSSIPNDMVSFLNAGSEKIKKAKRVVAEGRSVLELSKVKLLPPVTQPDKVVCVGLNYRDHCEEQKVPLPSEPMFFSKWSSCITGPYDDIPFPSITKNLDWEVEVALVIGRKARGIRPTSAMDYVFGMCAAQDITARDWQGKGPRSRNGGQWLIAKATDSSCPLGPALVQLSSIPDTKSMALRCSVNGELKQDGNTHNMIHSFEEIVAFLSHCCTLLPGDVILTGTPSGVGVFRKPPEYLKVGDVIESEVEGIGKLKNRIVEG